MTTFKKLTFRELRDILYEHELSGNPKHILGAIVFTEDSFKKKYSGQSRTYIVSSGNKAFQPGAISNSIFGTSLDNSDQNVRLDIYMRETNGKAEGWDVDFCYIYQK